MYYDELDAEAPLNIRSEVTRIPEKLPKVVTKEETVPIKVKPIVQQMPDEIGTVLGDRTDDRDIGSVNVIVCPSRREHQGIGARMTTEERCADGRVISQNHKAEETSVGTLMVIKEDLIVKPVPSPVIFEESEGTGSEEGTTEVCAFDISCGNETTKREVSTELLDISRQWIPQGFLRLAEEAKFVGVGNTPSGMGAEVLSEIAEVTELTKDSISWKIEEECEDSVISRGEVMREVTSIRFDVGQSMKWPDRKSDDTLICEFQLESELFSHDPVRREAEPVFVAAESEVFTPVFAGGSLLSRNPRLWQRQLHREFLFCRRLEVNSRPVCLRPLVGKTGGV